MRQTQKRCIERHKGGFSLHESLPRESTEGGRRGLYEHGRNKYVWYSLYSRGYRGRMKVNVRRSADAEEAMREWREKSDRSENIFSESVFKSTHYCDEAILKTMSICAYSEKEQPSPRCGRRQLSPLS